MKRLNLLLCLAFMGICCLCSAQTASVVYTDEIKVSGGGAALNTIGELDGNLYIMNSGFGRKVSDYKIEVFNSSDLKSAPKEIDLGKALDIIGKHDVAYYYLQNKKFYIISISKDQYFGSILDIEGKVEKSNISLYKTGMSKSSVDFAEFFESPDLTQFACVYKKKGGTGKFENYGVVVYDQDLKATATHNIKIPVADKNGETTDLFFSSNNRVYISVQYRKGAQAFVYDLGTKKVEEFPIPSPAENSGYRQGYFFESPDKTVWFGITVGNSGITSYTLFKQKATDPSPVLAEEHGFKQTTLEKAKKIMLFGGNDGLPTETYLADMVFGANGKSYMIFECRYDTDERTAQNSNGFYNIFLTNLVCVSLNSAGQGTDEAVIFKKQIASHAVTDKKRWTLAKREALNDVKGPQLSFHQAISFFAYEAGGKLHILFNDDKSNEDKNEEKPDKLANLDKANLVQVTVDGSDISKFIVLSHETTDLAFLPRNMRFMSGGKKVFTTGSSKRGGVSAVYVITIN